MALVKKEEEQPGAIIVGNVSSTSRLYGQQQEILIHRYSIPNAQHIYVNEGSNNSVFATHDFLSLYGGTPRYVDRHGEAAALVTKDLLQPLELKVQGNFQVGQGENHGRAFRGDSEALQGKSTAGPIKDVVVDSSRSMGKADKFQRERSDNLAYWSNVQVKFGFSDLISSQQPSSKHWLQTGQGLVEIAKNTVQVPSDDEEDDDEDCHDSKNDGNDKRLVTDNGNGKRLDNKGVIPRSKHSATEQRRRSKINDRFQMLRKLVPHSDQKRDKASFLLEVVDYVKSLQEKVRKYDLLQQGRQQERPKTMPLDSKTMKGSCSLGPPTFPKDYSCSAKIESLQSMELHGATIPPSSAVINLVQQNFCQDKEHTTTASRNTAAPQIPASSQTSDRNDSKLQTSADSSQAQSGSPRGQTESNQEQVHVMGGVINVSTVYSQGLLETLSGALQRSGLDLSQASISVHIELGKAPKQSSSKRALDSPRSPEQSHQSQESLLQQPSPAPISCETTPHKKPKLEP